MANYRIQDRPGVPKYKQLISTIEHAIKSGQLKKDEKLPSVNKICLLNTVSRDTVLLAYDDLKKRGIVYSIAGKGYYVRSLQIEVRLKIILVFDELNIFKEDIYNAFLAHIGRHVQVDIFFHHFNKEMFRKILTDANGNYSRYVIMPTSLENAAELIGTLPPGDVYILDQTNALLKSYPAVYQNFVEDVFKALSKGRKRLIKYQKLILIFPGFREPLGMKEGFIRFCTNFQYDYEVIAEFDNRTITAGEVYLIPNDRDLVSVIERSGRQRLRAGKDFGIISYNDTPLKKVVGNGITTISTDFTAMGRIMAEMIINGENRQIQNKCRLIIRKSL